MSQTITIPVEEYQALQTTLKQYREWLDTYEALEIAQQEKEQGQLQELNSLADLME